MVKYDKSTHRWYLVACVTCWATWLLIAAALFRFNRNDPLWSKLILSIPLLLLPVHFLANFRRYRQLRTAVLESNGQSSIEAETAGATALTLTRQMQLPAFLTPAMLNVLHMFVRHHF